MYINAQELYTLSGKQSNDKAISEMNKLIYARNKKLDNIDDVLKIIDRVALENNLSFKDILSDTRKRNIVDARSEATYVLFLLGYRDCVINKVFKKDHSTIVYYRQRVKDEMSISTKYKLNFYNKYCHILESFQITNNLNMN